MTDVIDEAQQRAADFSAAGVAKVRRFAAVLAGETASDDCDGCGELIDPERRKALPGTRRCVHCQAAVERRAREFVR